MSTLLTGNVPTLLASLILGSIILRTGSVILKVLLTFLWLMILLIPVLELNPEFYFLFLLLITLCLVSYLFNDNLKKKHEFRGLKQSLYFIIYVMILSQVSYTVFTEEIELSYQPETLFFILFMLIIILLVKNILLKDRGEYED